VAVAVVVVVVVVVVPVSHTILKTFCAFCWFRVVNKTKILWNFVLAM